MVGDRDLIAATYDAGIDPSGWEKAVKRIVAATKSVSGGLHIRQAEATPLLASDNLDPVYVDAYAQTWNKLDPLIAIGLAASLGAWKTCTCIAQTDKFRASAFFNEFMRPQEHADLIGVSLVRGPHFSAHLALHRSQDAVWVEPKEWNLLETLAPHLKRAAEIHQLLSRARTSTDSLGAAVAAAGFAAFLLTEDCRVIFANAKAEDLVRRGAGLRYEHGWLAAATPYLAHRLHALAREAARPLRAEGDIGGSLGLPCGKDRQPLLAHIFPVAANRTALIFDFDRPAVAVFAADPAADLAAQVRRFGTKFGLTPAETRVLAEIIGGNGLQSAAESLKIARTTARTHADRILGKTGTHRQAELIRLFFEMSLPGSPATI